MGLALCFVLLVVLVGCRSPGAVRPAVKIGLVAPFEGRYRYTGYDVIYAVRLALREANAAGGVGGYSIELVAYDDGADPTMAAEQARKLAADPEVVAAIGHFREETTAAALSAYAEAGIPLVAPAVLDPALTEGDGAVFRLGPDAGTLAVALLDGVQTATLVGDGPLGNALQEVARERGVRLAPIALPDGDAWPAEMLTSDTITVICDAGSVTAGEVVAALREAGWEGDFLGGPELAATDFAAVAGEAAEGAIFVTPYPFPGDETGFFLKNPVSGEQADFIAAYRAVSNGVPPGPLALPAYEATWVLLEALERDIAAHGVPTREGVAAALPATGRDGLLGHVTFDAERNWGGAPLYWYRVGVEGAVRLQVADDFNGVWHPEGVSDLNAGWLTLPVCYGLSVAEAEERERLETLLEQAAQGDDVAEVQARQLLTDLGVQAYLLVVGRVQHQQAVEALRSANRVSPAGQQLFALLDQVLSALSRSFFVPGVHHGCKHLVFRSQMMHPKLATA